MSISAVFPEVAMGFAESVTHAVAAAEKAQWSDEDVRQVRLACREVRQKFEWMDQIVRRALVDGVDAATFVAQAETHRTRLDRLLLQFSAIQAAARSDDGEFVVEFEGMGKAISRVRDLLNEVLTKMKTPRRPIDWQRVEEAQAAYVRGETKPFKRAPTLDGD
jgi:hypothetical protein